MKRQINYRSLVNFFVIGVIVGLIAHNIAILDRLQEYKDYYQKTEALLDDLETHLNWVDRYDSDILCDYQVARKAITVKYE